MNLQILQTIFLIALINGTHSQDSNEVFRMENAEIQIVIKTDLQMADASIKQANIVQKYINSNDPKSIKLHATLTRTITKAQNTRNKFLTVAGEQNNRYKRNIIDTITNAAGSIIGPTLGLATQQEEQQTSRTIKLLSKETSEITHMANDLVENQHELFTKLNKTIQIITRNSDINNRAYGALKNQNLMLSTVMDLEESVDNVDKYYNNRYKLAESTLSIIDALSAKDLQKIDNIINLPSNAKSLPSLSILENLKLASINNFITYTPNNPILTTQITFKKFSPTDLRIVGSSKGNLFLSSDLNTNYHILPTNYDIHVSRKNKIFLTGRFIQYYKTKTSWDDELIFSSDYRMISSNMIATMKEITPHVTCGKERTKIKVLAFSIIKIPHHCSLATEHFAIKPYRSTTDLSISESIDFLKISYGKNVTKIHHVQHVTLNEKTLNQLNEQTKTEQIESIIPLNPLITQTLIALACSMLPWIILCVAQNTMKTTA